mmetsp:Transcript_12387/g.33806  ORF Transcript_12387/g.33806 Transcript_12387/m.33806 type:complete len:201 (-) Transcript_12387:396-998(-)
MLRKHCADVYLPLRLACVEANCARMAADNVCRLVVWLLHLAGWLRETKVLHVLVLAQDGILHFFFNAITALNNLWKVVPHRHIHCLPLSMKLSIWFHANWLWGVVVLAPRCVPPLDHHGASLTQVPWTSCVGPRVRPVRLHVRTQLIHSVCVSALVAKLARPAAGEAAHGSLVVGTSGTDLVKMVRVAACRVLACPALHG